MRKVLNSIFNFFVSLLLVIIVVAPLMWMFLMSIKSEADIVAWPPKFFFTPTLENYKNIFLNPANSRLSFSLVLKNSIIITIITLIVSLALSTLSSYALGRLKPVGYRGLNYLILGLRMIPPIAIVVPLFIIWNNIGLYDTIWGLIIPYVAINIPLATWLLEGFFEAIPGNLEDAASIDGCTGFQAFRKNHSTTCSSRNSSYINFCILPFMEQPYTPSTTYNV